MRKVIIGLIAAACVTAAFWAYVMVSDSSPIKAPETAAGRDLDMPASDRNVQRTGDTVVREVQKSQYVILDPQTKEVSRVLGFEKLLNPGMETSRWVVENPYMIFYDARYECRVDSDTGTFQIDPASSNTSPKDAQLVGHVEIRIIPQENSKLSETVIRMEDLTFSSERSEFATDGPVVVESDQVRLDGFGLILIFNTASGRIDYLNIRDLTELRLYGLADSDGASQSQGQSLTRAPAAKRLPSERPPAADSSVVPDSTVDQTGPVVAGDYYQCILADDVTIDYGQELIVAGADQVNIQNIVFSGMEQTPAKKTPRQTNRRPANKDSAAPAPAKTVADRANPIPEKDPQKDVVVKCRGGIILKPMQDDSTVTNAVLSPELSVEMTGSPLKIDRLPFHQNSGGSFVQCGYLQYNPAQDILKLFTRPEQPQIVLNAHPSGSRIQTCGNVLWNRKAQSANITGPGQVFFSNPDISTEPSEVMFNGVMDVLFAKAADMISSPTIRTVNLTGGMNAILKQNGWYKTAANSAIFEFGSENTLSEAQLSGDVQFESMQTASPQRVAADAAQFEFGPQNTLTAARMQGDVLFESANDTNQSRANADTAIFHFDQNKIHTADLKGAVSFVSDAGILASTDATIDFKPDDQGQIRPEAVHTHGDTVLETVSTSPAGRPAKFEARRIDYDLMTGSGVALGPVRFTFYQPDDSKGSTADSDIPVTITADKNAEFLAGPDRRIRQVVFNENVLAIRRVEQAPVVQLDTFHGNTLTISLDDAAEGTTDISRIQLTDGDVTAESQKTRDDQVLSHVKLYCKEIDFSQVNNTIAAIGPGKIELNNSQVAVAETIPAGPGFDLRRPCFVYCEGFDQIRWDLGLQAITAEGQHESMQMAYVPLEQRTPEKFIFVNSSRFDISFLTDPAGKTVLERIFTDQGIVYKEDNFDRTKTLHTIVGQTLEYDQQGTDSWIRIEGTPAVPVNVDGSRLPQVFVNPQTGEMKASLSTIPGVLKR